MPARSLVALAVLAALAAGVALGVTACSRDARQTEVIGEQTQPGSITPLQRGEVRRVALDAARTGMAAWLRNDLAAMRSSFATEQVGFYRQLDVRNRAAGRKRVRVHLNESFEVIDMSSDGREVLVTYAFKDGSYDASLGGARLSAPPNRDTEMQLTLDKVEDRWLIMRMVAGDQELK